MFQSGRDTPPAFRKAEPGDCFLLFVPSAEELKILQSLLGQFQTIYEGFSVQVIHLTCQRFSLKDSQVDKVVTALQKNLCNEPFPLVADTYQISSSRFTKKQSLSWALIDRSPWYAFREKVNACLKSLKILPHYTNTIKGHFTLLYEITHTEFEDHLVEQFPRQLFEAKTLKLSRMNETFKFDELHRFDLQPCTGDLNPSGLTVSTEQSTL